MNNIKEEPIHRRIIFFGENLGMRGPGGMILGESRLLAKILLTLKAVKKNLVMELYVPQKGEGWIVEL
jgi:hypothetical protein